MDWWNSLTLEMQFFWTVSIVGTVLFVLQLALNFLGHDIGAEDAGTDIEITSDFEIATDFSLFSLRSILAFLALFGWTGIVMLHKGYTLPIAVIASLFTGFAAMFSVAYLFYLFFKMQDSGSEFYPYQALGQIADVYLTIPPNKEGSGLIHITLDGNFRELQAITEQGAPIVTGQKIRIIDVQTDNTVVVETLQQIET